MIDQEFKTDETKQLEQLNRGIEDVQWQLNQINDGSLTGVRKSLIAIDSHNFEARLIGWVQICLLALILWRIW